MLPLAKATATSASLPLILFLAFRYSLMLSWATGLTFNVTHRDRMVGSMRSLLSTSNIIRAYAGGSSRVFSRAFCASSVIIDASGTIYILRGE